MRPHRGTLDKVVTDLLPALRRASAHVNVTARKDRPRSRLFDNEGGEMKRRILLMLGAAGLAGTIAATVALAALGSETGPSSSQSPYIVRSQPGVVTKSIITVGDAAANGYRMVGIPDGLGAYDNGNGTFTVLMNHELSAGSGIVRSHGSKGAFVSRWVIRKDDLSVVSGRDLISTVYLWQDGAYVAGTTAFERFCSANLAAPEAFYNPLSGKGQDGRIFMNGEEAGNEGRAFAHLTDGTSYQLPYLGRLSYENSVANPGTGDRTVVASTDDSGGGQVYLYFGDKKSTGNAVDKAGLSGGKLYGVKVAGLSNETDVSAVADGTAFTLAPLGDVSAKSGATLNSDSVAAGVTGFQRPEDGSWDPTNPSVFYFVTTASFTGKSRLWRLTFADPADPAAGGTIDMVLDGTEGQHMFDNITVNDRGQVLLQEDPGDQPHVAKLWLYNPASDTLTEIAHHDDARFAPGAPGFLTQDEESSGIIPAPFLGEGKYLADVQAHYASPDPELVQGGQLLVLQVPPGNFSK